MRFSVSQTRRDMDLVSIRIARQSVVLAPVHGFCATAVRSALTVRHLTSRARDPMKAFASLDAAL